MRDDIEIEWEEIVAIIREAAETVAREERLKAAAAVEPNEDDTTLDDMTRDEFIAHCRKERLLAAAKRGRTDYIVVPSTSIEEAKAFLKANWNRQTK